MPDFPLSVRPGRRAVEEDSHVHVQRLGDLFQYFNVRTGMASLIMRDGLTADMEPLCQLILGDSALDPGVPDVFADVPHVHHLLSGLIISPGGEFCHAQNLSGGHFARSHEKNRRMRSHPPVFL